MKYHPVKLFSNKAAVYKKSRPNYPIEAIEYIFSNLNILTPTAVDIGAGPGRFTNLLLKRCDLVYAIEPNEAMREQLIQYIGRNNKLKLLDFSAEKINLPNETADIISVAHAFHWFDKIKCKEEFKRILKKDGKVALLWNIYANTPAMQDYNYLIHEKCATSTTRIYLKEEKIEEDLNDFFISYEKTIYPHSKELDFSNILNLSESAHCTPVKNEQGYDFMKRELEKWFNKYKYNEKIEFSYNCVLFLGNI